MRRLRPLLLIMLVVSLVVALSVWTSSFWQTATPRKTDQTNLPLHHLAGGLFGTFFVQLILGAVVRHHRKWHRGSSFPGSAWERTSSQAPSAETVVIGGSDSGGSSESDSGAKDSHEPPRIADDPRSQRGPSIEADGPKPEVAGDEPSG